MMRQIDEGDWLPEHIEPYLSARRKLFGISPERIPSRDTVDTLRSAEDNFWVFICEYNMQQRAAGKIFNEYLECTSTLNMSRGHDSRDIIIRCLGLGMLLLAKMEEVYGSFASGLTWNLDHPSPVARKECAESA